MCVEFHQNQKFQEILLSDTYKVCCNIYIPFLLNRKKNAYSLIKTSLYQKVKSPLFFKKYQREESPISPSTLKIKRIIVLSSLAHLSLSSPYNPDSLKLFHLFNKKRNYIPSLDSTVGSNNHRGEKIS